MADFITPDFPADLLANHHDTFGISYDIFTNQTERAAPHGWHAKRSHTYSQLISVLQEHGFHREQYSDYTRVGTDVVFTWNIMFLLVNILPPGKFESTVKCLKMFSYSHYHLMDVSHRVRLGGEFSQTLRGPTPRNLVTQAMETPGYILIPHPQPLPANAILNLPGTPAPGNPAHWLQ